MAEEEKTKPGAFPVSALQMATSTRGRFRVDLDIITLVCDTLMDHYSECSF